MEDRTYPLIEPLSEREIDILQAISDGHSNQQIANQLHLALTTVKWYNTQIYGKLGVKNRDEAVQRARVLSLLDNDDTPATVHNLPTPTTPFIGRYQELLALDRLLHDPDVRIITILAAGGMGKTRLAIQSALQSLPLFEDGAYLIELATLSDHEAIVPTIVEMLALQGYGDATDLKSPLLQYLGQQQLLMVFDNFEHILEAGSLLTEICQAAPHVKLMVTSRERLNLQGETVFGLMGMTTPSAQDDLLEVDAVKLFMQAAQRTQPDYVLTETDLSHVVRICQLVDGMPLALELAAGWMDVLSPQKIADEIQNCFDILETEMRDMPPRHRSVRASFDQTWQGLSKREQQIMMQLSVFRGGISQSAAENVGNADLRTLKRLVNKALLQRDQQGRYTIHELLRQYLEERLDEAGALEVTLDQYATFVVDHVIEQWFGNDEIEGGMMQGIAPDAENMIRAWSRLVATHDYELIERFHPAIIGIFCTLGRSTEAEKMFRNAIDLVRDAAAEDTDLNRLYGGLLVNWAASRIDCIPDDEHEAILEQAITLLEPFGPSNMLVWAYNSALAIPFIMHDTVLTGWDEKIEPLIQNILKSLALSEALDDPDEIAHNLCLLAMIYRSLGDFDKAWEMANRSQAVVQSREVAAFNRSYLAYIMASLCLRTGQHAKAIAFADDSLAIIERQELLYTTAVTRTLKLDAYLKMGDTDNAKRECAAILHWHRKIGRDWQMLGALYGAYAEHLLIPLAEYERASEILSFVHHHPLSVNSSVEASQLLLDEIEAKMDTDQFQAACERGRISIPASDR